MMSPSFPTTTSSPTTTMPKLAPLLLLLVAAGQLAATADTTTTTNYALVDSYTASNFFDSFDFFSGSDPTHGFVDYQNASAASSSGLAGYTNGMVYLGADHTTAHPANGRASTRVSSKKAYTHMLLVADLAHMPVGCGTWPALWTFGPSWPSSGEIDMLEGVNSQASNEITLHTDEGCVMAQGTALAGTKMAASTDCGAGGGNNGCPQTTTGTDNYGAGLNAAGGGVYALEWDAARIAVWWFPRNSSNARALAADAKSLNTSAFGTPTAQFVGGRGCDIDSYFKNHNIVIDTTFCGDWAGKDSIWSADDECSALAKTCKDYVSGTPSAFTDAYWTFNYINVYQTTSSGNGTGSPPASSSSTSSTATPTATTTTTTSTTAVFPAYPTGTRRPGGRNGRRFEA